MRTCLGCRTRRPATDLVRLNLAGDRLEMDVRGIGRGAWMCPDLRCFATATKRKRWSTALRQQVPTAAVEDLAVRFEQHLRFRSGTYS